ncbi:cytochrome P450 2K4-like [Oncorhynchus masou masou]|uniref:cytochrome P450 2K4-like n=1 Tax=Oncorhynchus masou masou TaxID=90313 RepID=UPI003182E11B
MESHYHENNLISSVTNLFGADRIQEEISRVTGSRQPLEEDKKNLRFTDAVIHETQRLPNIVPMSIPHTTSRDVTFQEYFIKKVASVIPLLMSVLQDNSEWESLHSFNPSHFLDESQDNDEWESLHWMSSDRDAFMAFSAVTEDDLDLTPSVGFTLHLTSCVL